MGVLKFSKGDHKREGGLKRDDVKEVDLKRKAMRFQLGGFLNGGQGLTGADLNWGHGVN